MGDVNLKLTTAGQILAAKIEKGDGTIPLEITRIVTASGKSDDPLNLTDVVDERQQFEIKSRTINGTRAIIEAFLTNFGNPLTGEPPLEEGYELGQIGFFAIDPDEGEILYRISQFENTNWVPPFQERPWEFRPTFNFTVGNASDVIIEINPSGLATREDIWNSIEMSDVDVPINGVRMHLRIVADVPGYLPFNYEPGPPEPPVTISGFLDAGGRVVPGAIEAGGKVSPMVLQSA